jgi:MFS family permease
MADNTKIQTNTNEDSHAPSQVPSLHQSHSDDEDVEKAEPTSTTQIPYSVFSVNQKRFIVFMVSLAGFISPLSSSIYFPALNSLAVAYHKSDSIINLTVTSYMIFQALAPTVVGGLSEAFGRRPMYVAAFTVYMGANIGLALQNSYTSLLVLRCLQSAGSSGTISLALGVVADISTSSERGTYIGYAVSGFM